MSKLYPCVYCTEDGYCKKYSDEGVTSWCVQHPCEDEKPSNADRIRQMTDYDLADWIAKILDHCENKKPEELCRQSCPLYKCCNDQPSDNIEDWLKAPVEVDE